MPAELMPNVDNVPAIGHSGAFCADETATIPGAVRTAAKQIALDRRMKNSFALFPSSRASTFPSARLIWIKDAQVKDCAGCLPIPIAVFRCDAGPAYRKPVAKLWLAIVLLKRFSSLSLLRLLDEP